MKVEIEDGRLIVTPITEEDSRIIYALAAAYAAFDAVLIAASAYAQAINAASFREGKNVLGTGGSYIAPITREEVENQKKAFEEALSAFFDEVEALRQLTSVHHGEPQTGGISHRDQPATRDRDSAGS